MSARAKGNDREERRKKSQGQDGDWDEGMEIGRRGEKKERRRENIWSEG